MKSKILSVLREADGYISGQQLCEELGVSRTAVWKVIEKLKGEGYEIEAVRNRGYRLVESPDVMSKAEIESLIETTWAGNTIQYFPEVDSTNIYAKRVGDEPGGHGTLIVSDKQTAGKGRRGRVWESPSGSSIYMSLLLKPDIRPDQASMLTLVMAQSVAKAMRKMANVDAKIKWPNDIVLNGKKVCGMLTEMTMEMDYIQSVVIGVGINVNTKHFPKELSHATSLYLETGNIVKRSELIAETMRQFEYYYDKFVEEGDLSGIQEEYNSLLVNRDRDVKVLEPSNEYQGHALGINEMGELIVRKEDGEFVRIYAGEVSVRGIYGYV